MKLHTFQSRQIGVAIVAYIMLMFVLYPLYMSPRLSLYKQIPHPTTQTRPPTHTRPFTHGQDGSVVVESRYGRTDKAEGASVSVLKENTPLDRRILVGTEYINNHGNWTILLTINNGFLDFFQNWFWYFQQLNINYPIIVIAEDDKVFAKLIAVYGKLVKIRRSKLQSVSEPADYNTTLYKKLVSTRASHILEYLKLGLNVLYVDADAVWLNNPFPFLRGNYDMWMQLDDKNNLCTGFLAINSNNETIQFIQKWEMALQVKPQHNQLIFNKLIVTSKVRHTHLNSNKFPSGIQFFDKFTYKQRSEVIVVHNNYIIGHDEKLQRFKEHKLWFGTYGDHIPIEVYCVSALMFVGVIFLALVC